MTPAPPRPPGCPSDFTLDRLDAGELPSDGGAQLRQHVASCAACQGRAAARAQARAAFHADAPPFAAICARTAAPVAPTTAPPPRPRRLAWPAAGSALAALGVVLALASPWSRPEPDRGTRIKGAERLGFYVLHAGQVRRGIHGEVVQPGDGLRFTVTTPARRYVAVLSLDGSRRASVYFPRGAEAEPVAPGDDVPLPLSTVLDAVPGPETLHGVFCDRPFTVEPLREALERRGTVDPLPPGCDVDAVEIRKDPRSR